MQRKNYVLLLLSMLKTVMLLNIVVKNKTVMPFNQKSKNKE